MLLLFFDVLSQNSPSLSFPECSLMCVPVGNLVFLVLVPLVYTDVRYLV